MLSSGTVEVVYAGKDYEMIMIIRYIFCVSLQASQPVTSAAQSGPQRPGPPFGAATYQPFGFPGYNQFGPEPVAPPQQSSQSTFNAAPAPPSGASGRHQMTLPVCCLLLKLSALSLFSNSCMKVLGGTLPPATKKGVLNLLVATSVALELSNF